MSRIVPAKEMDLIEKVISDHTGGIGISALEKALTLYLSKPINRRTLQRRLKAMIEEKRIVTEGESIALVYKHYIRKDKVVDFSSRVRQRCTSLYLRMEALYVILWRNH